MRRSEEISISRPHEYRAGAEFVSWRPRYYFSYCHDKFLLNGHNIESKPSAVQALHDPHISTPKACKVDLQPRGTAQDRTCRRRTSITPRREKTWAALAAWDLRSRGRVRSCVLDLMKYGQIYLGGGVAPTVSASSPMTAKGECDDAMYRTSRVANTSSRWSQQELTPTSVQHGGSTARTARSRSNFGSVREGIFCRRLTIVTSVPAAATCSPQSTRRLASLDTMKRVDTERVHDTAALCPGSWATTGVGGRVHHPRVERSASRGHAGRVGVPAKAATSGPCSSKPEGSRHVLRFYFVEEVQGPSWDVLAHSRMLRGSILSAV
jgi:hypothetical protein